MWFNPWVRKITWRRKWQPNPVFLPGKFHRQRSLVDYKEMDTIECSLPPSLSLSHTHTHLIDSQEPLAGQSTATHLAYVLFSGEVNN